MDTKISKTVKASLLAAALAVSSVSTSTAESEPVTVIQPGQSLAGNYLAARIANTDRDTESAAAFYRQAMELDDENIELKQQAFQTFIANGDFDEGVELGEALAKLGQAPEMARIVLAVNHIRGKAWTSAQRELTHNWRAALDRLVAGLVLGWAQVGEGKFEEAQKSVDELKGPDWYKLFVQYHSGLIALSAGDSKGGIARLEKAVANIAGGQGANSTYMRVVQSLAQAYWKNDNKKKAEEMVDRALSMQPRNPVFKAMKAKLSTKDGLAAPVSTPQRGAAEVFLNLGTAVNKDGGEQFARVYLQLAATLAGDDEVILMRLADLYDQQNLSERSNALFAKIEPKSPYYRIAQLEIAINLDAAENIKASKAIFEELIESGPRDVTAHLSYASVLSRHEKFDEVIPLLHGLTARLNNPIRLHWPVFYRLGIAYERTKDWPKAEAVFRRALELYPDQPSVLNYLGYSWVDMGINLEEGLKMIHKAVSIRPNDGYMVDSLGWAYYKMGRYEEAVEDLERAVSLRPSDPTINDHLGDAYWRSKRKLEATFQWRHALSLDPPVELDISKIEDKLKNGLAKDEMKKVAEPDKKKPDNG